MSKDKSKAEEAPLRPTPDIVIEGGMLLTMVRGQAPVRNARIEIKGDRIVAVKLASKEPLSEPGTEMIDARHGIVMPGLVNAHVHIAMTIFRGLADDLPLEKWLFDRVFPAEAAHVNPESVYWGTLLGCLEMLSSGATTAADGYFFEHDAARAVRASGMRALLAQGVVDFPAPGIKDPKDNLEVGRRFVERWDRFSPLIRPGLFCHSPLTCSPDTFRGAMEISRRYNLPLQTHLSETLAEVEGTMKKTGRRPLCYLDSIGLAGKDLLAAHAVHLDDEELEILETRGVRIAHAPESNMKLSSGVARIPEMLRKGLAVGLGTDGCASNNNLDLFQEMDLAAKLHKVFWMDPVCMDAETILEMATIGGAEALGLEKEIGTIEVGKKADVIVLDLRSPHMAPLYNPASNIVYSADGGDVTDVIVNGRILVKGRAFVHLDVEEILQRAAEICRKIQP